MTTEREKIQPERKALRREYGELYDRVSRLLFKWDPIGINFDDDTDEYEPEVGTILPRLRSCVSAEDVQKVVHEEFCRWCDADQAGPLDSYERIGGDLWAEIRGTRWSGEPKPELDVRCPTRRCCGRGPRLLSEPRRWTARLK